MFATKIAEGGRARRLSGFTMVELLITIAIASILMAVAVPSFNQMIVSSRLTTQANDLVSAVNLARSEAIKRNASITLCSADDVDATECAGAGDWEHWIVRTGTGTVVRRGVVNASSGTVVVQSTLTGNQVVFGSDGLARTGGGLVNDHAITICSRRTDTNNARSVVLGAGSRISTQTLSRGC
jgi:type IV fimbrial biogenesis protein FimT